MFAFTVCCAFISRSVSEYCAADSVEADREAADQFCGSNCSRNGISVQPQVRPSWPGSKELHVSLVADLSLVHTLQKWAPETGAINSTPDSGASFSCRLHLARKNWRRFMASKLIMADDRDTALFILNLTPNRKVFCEEKFISNSIFFITPLHSTS